MITSAGEGRERNGWRPIAPALWEYCTHPLDGEGLVVKLDTFMRCKREVDQVRSGEPPRSADGLYNMNGWRAAPGRSGRRVSAPRRACVRRGGPRRCSEQWR